MSEQVTAIVLAAGAGTRMKSAKAKVLHEVGGQSMVAHALRAVTECGVTRTVAVIGHDRQQVAAHLNEVAAGVSLAVQEHQGGTGHAVQVALAALGGRPSGTVLVTYGDVPLLSGQTLRELLDDHRAAGRAVTILTAELDDPAGYGRIVRDTAGAVTAIREDKDASDDERAIREVNSGILALDADFLADALTELGSDNAQGELYLTDVVGIAAAAGRPVGAHVLEDIWQTEGVNDRTQLARLGAELNRRTCDHWMREGVTIVDPATTWIDSAVTIGPDSMILPGTQLLGATTIGADVTVGPDTTLRNVAVGNGATVIRTHGTDAFIGARATVGPFAYLRPGTELGAAGKIGTFVETKNARLGDGAKVPHLSYVGDAEIGDGSNIGAGTIFANYDGINKHRTTVGKHARTGANNVFIAPVEIGDGAYTAGLTAIRNDVPAGAIAVGDTTQRIIDHWVQRNRANTPAAEAAQAVDAGGSVADNKTATSAPAGEENTDG